MKTLKKILLILVPLGILAFLLFCILFPSPSRYTKKFMRNLTNIRLNLAYEMTSLEFHENVDFRDFTELTDALAVDSIKHYKINSVEIFGESKDKTATLELELTYSEFDPEIIDIKLSKQGRKWKVNIINANSDIYEQIEA